MVRWSALGLVAIAVAACALFAEDPPANVCASDEQCFRAQGEVCNLETKRCEPGPDAGVPDKPPERGARSTAEGSAEVIDTALVEP
ncbi:MAG: hypothetical protein ABI867_00810 [Kofleriaceae bacterium]